MKFSSLTKKTALFLATGMISPAMADISITVYNDDFAVVREKRDIEFTQGLNTIKFTDVASAIDPTSVSFKCLNQPGMIRVLEQNYEYDLFDTESLLKRYLDKQVVLMVEGSGSSGESMVNGILSAAVGGDLIIRQAQGEMKIIRRDSIQSIELAAAPKDLVTKPTLVWLANATAAGTNNCEVTYTTNAINWKADYTVILNADDTALDFSGWVTIDNRSGASYNDAKIKLIAGDVRRVAPQPRPMMAKSMRMDSMEMSMDQSMSGFVEKSFMEYHMYTLGRPSTIGNNQTKQIEFVEPVAGVNAVKEFVYETGRENRYFGGDYDPSREGKVQIKIKFDNKEDNKLGIALPKGKVRTFKADQADGSLEFVGEDTIEHTPRNEKISLYIGNAFDLVVEEVVTDQRNGNRFNTITKEITLKNRKKEAVEINVEQYINREFNWEISKCSIDAQSVRYEKVNAGLVRIPVKVPADKEVKLTYTYTESW